MFLKQKEILNELSINYNWLFLKMFDLKNMIKKYEEEFLTSIFDFGSLKDDLNLIIPLSNQ